VFGFWRNTLDLGSAETRRRSTVTPRRIPVKSAGRIFRILNNRCRGWTDCYSTTGQPLCYRTENSQPQDTGRMAIRVVHKLSNPQPSMLCRGPDCGPRSDVHGASVDVFFGLTVYRDGRSSILAQRLVYTWSRAIRIFLRPGICGRRLPST